MGLAALSARVDLRVFSGMSSTLRRVLSDVAPSGSTLRVPVECGGAVEEKTPMAFLQED